MTRNHSVTLPDGLSDELQERAKRERRSLSSLISFLIEAKLREIQATEALLGKRDGVTHGDTPR
jgi:hypothetical protein